MGYETRIYVVKLYNFSKTDDRPMTGEQIAMIDLCKCMQGPLGSLMQKYIALANAQKKPQFALWAFNPDRQGEAVSFLRRSAPEKDDALITLSNDIEDGVVTKDCYGDRLGVIPIDEFITALEEEMKEENYRRFKWALVLLKSIREDFTDATYLKIVTYGH